MGGLAHRLPWHPIAFAAAYVGILWVEAAISPFAGFRSLGVAIGAAATVQLGFTLLMQNAQRAGLITTALVALVVSKGFVATAATAAAAMSVAVAAVWFTLIAAVVVLAVRIVMRGRRRWSAAGATYGLNVASACLLAVAVATGVSAGRAGMVAQDLDQGRSWEAGAAGAPSETTPDIYVLLLDGYPSADTLADVFGYDNAPFLSELEARGFATASASRSDYLWTHLTMISMLHRDYLERVDALAALRADGGPIHPLVRHAMNDNPTFDDLRGAGYEIHTTAVPIERYALRGSDYLIDGGNANEFEIALLASTLASDVINFMAPEFAAEEHRRRIVHDLAMMANIANQEGGPPRLVLAHLITPHHPVVWAADGSPVNPPLDGAFYSDTLVEQATTREEFIDRFVGQLPQLNRLVLNAVDTIVRSERPSVVIVMSDHGSGLGIHPANAEAGDLRERTGILFASRTPGRPNVFPNDVSPVNVFRILFDEYLGTSLGTVEPVPGGLQVEVND